MNAQPPERSEADLVTQARTWAFFWESMWKALLDDAMPPLPPEGDPPYWLTRSLAIPDIDVVRDRHRAKVKARIGDPSEPPNPNRGAHVLSEPGCVCGHSHTRIVEDALADMRCGRNVLVIAADFPAVVKLFGEGRMRLEWKESARRTNSNGRITHLGGGGILFEQYASVRAAVHGLKLDRVYFDHSAVLEVVGPVLAFSESPRISHYPADER